MARDVVVDLPVKPRRCGDCENALFGPGGVYCRAYHEDIWNERIAEECELWEPTPMWLSGRGTR